MVSAAAIKDKFTSERQFGDAKSHAEQNLIIILLQFTKQKAGDRINPQSVEFRPRFLFAS
jgi:hypothetical protein